MSDTDPPASTAIGTPDFGSDPETERVRTTVIASLFGDEPEIPRIGRYPIFARVGAGGMGAVYACYDEQLDRRIAVKVLHRDLQTPSVRARMIREAQAMAKLSHPNVAHVYEVGEDNGRMFVAMEFVKGQTLRAWWEAQSRRWQEVVDVMLAAGRGLAAAHEQGLVHRDFKPDNVMVADDGRVRVMDFGLARTERGRGHELPNGTSVHAEDGVAITRRSALIGTPAYMAPEQLFDGESGPSTDQFAYCVTLWEALFTSRPFVGESVAELADALRAGRLAQPARHTRVPSWLRRLLARGLDHEPTRRFASMAELLASLERGARRRRSGLLALAGVVAAAGVAGAMQLRADEGCPPVESQLAGIWDQESTDAIASAFAATGADLDGQVWRTTSERIDAYTRDWADGYALRCEQMEATGSESARLGLACLEQRRTYLEMFTGVMREADREVVGGVDLLVTNFGPIDECLRDDVLSTVAPPPADPVTRVTVARLWFHGTAMFSDLSKEPDFEGLVAAAKATGHRPTEAAALRAWAEFHEGRRDYERAAELYEDAMLAAVAGGDDRLADVVSVEQAKCLASIGRVDEAAKVLRRAQSFFERTGDPATGTHVMVIEAALLSSRGRDEESVEKFEAAIAFGAPELGPTHQYVMRAHRYMVDPLIRLGRHEEAIDHASFAVTHEDNKFNYMALSSALESAGQYQRAREAEVRVLEIELDERPPAWLHEIRLRLTDLEYELGNLQRAAELAAAALVGCADDGACDPADEFQAWEKWLHARIGLGDPPAQDEIVIERVAARMRAKRPELMATFEYLREAKLGALSLARGEIDEAHGLLSHAEQTRRAGSLRDLDVVVASLPSWELAVCSVLRGEGALAVTTFRRHLQQYEHADLSLSRALTRAWLARALRVADPSNTEAIAVAEASLAELDLMGPDVEHHRRVVREWLDAEGGGR